MRNFKNRFLLIGVFLLGIIFLLGLVFAVSWNPDIDTFYGVEDYIYFYNVSKNVTDVDSNLEIDIDTTLNNITWERMNISSEFKSFILIPWFSFNKTSFILSINSISDNQTGKFSIPFQAKDSQTDGTTKLITFIIKAINDPPEFSNIQEVYNLNSSEEFFEFLNATDEINESHYPLVFDIDFFDNCTHAYWSGRNDNENCSLYDFGFNLTNIPDISSIMNFTPSFNDVGEYWANISVRDFGENYSCPHQNLSYCEDNYQTNKTTWQIARFNVLASLEIRNISDCQNKIFNESYEGTCNITIGTKFSESNLSISSIANLRNYQQGHRDWINQSWFVSDKQVSSLNNFYTLEINVTPGKTEVGNWTINLTIMDLDSGEEPVSEEIYIYVNKTTSSNPVISQINNITTATYAPNTINFNVSDNDFLIPDKNQTYGGFKEYLNFSLRVFNSSDFSELDNSSFDLEVINMPFLGTNRTDSRILFNLSESYIGNLTVNLSVFDSESNFDYQLFNITLVNNSAPLWNEELISEFVLNESDSFYLNLSQNVSDPEGDELIFSYEILTDYDFPSFQTIGFDSNTGEIDFTATKSDVGNHLINISVSDGFHVVTRTFNFTILHINNAPIINSLEGVNTSDLIILNNSFINCSEGDLISLYLEIEDLDFKILQNNFYQEELNVSLFIQGENPDLFEFIFVEHLGGEGESYSFSFYDAIFTPGYYDSGIYNITINVTDNLGDYDWMFFQLNITPLDHEPVINNVKNFSLIVNETLFYNFNGTDLEDGHDTEGNLNYFIDFIQGDDFINGNQGIFNTTLGILNMSFNSSHEGMYHLNITITDTDGLNYSEYFWIYVYGFPVILFPPENYLFENLFENQPHILNFSANHSIRDNLNYAFWIDNITCSFNDSSNCSYTDFFLRDSIESFGNGSNISWNFTPGFLDETYGNLKNLTLIVYPATDELNSSQKNIISVNQTFKLNISHIPSDIEFVGNIPDLGPVSYGSNLTLRLYDYFLDYDFIDPYYDKEVNFIFYTNQSESLISVDYHNSSWIARFISDENQNILESFNITVNKSGVLVESNNFLVEFLEANVVEEEIETPLRRTQTRDVEVPVLLKILFPEDISAVENDKINVSIKLLNNGTQTLNRINLSAYVAKDSVLREDFNISLSQYYFNSIAPGEEESVLMNIEVGRVGEGIFEINVNASVENPFYNDWNKIFLRVSDLSEVEERLLFASEFILENPECAELREIINEGERLLDSREFEKAYDKAIEAIDACKKLMASAGRSSYRDDPNAGIYRYLSYSSLFLFLVIFIYYIYRRSKLKLKHKNEENLSSGESIK